ncbi:DUF1648 domain-containing protein [Adlercreutzia aquisgranensis]|uniref:DUF1648 domain-containing protein n=1 Tax=Adlercreutzia aquisgranensis TaxID=2941323 RepID=UPI00204108F3|nr:DUF1648 domain-containing protein [Adlercreutzia aquisgranensis]
MIDAITFSPSEPAGAFFWVFALATAVTGLLVALTPYLMPKRECFAVTVPDAASSDPYLKGLKRRYLLWTVALAVVALAASTATYLAFGIGGYIAVFTVGLMALCVASFGLMLYFRAKVRAYKQQMGWTATEQAHVALVGDEPMPHAISMKWDLLFLAIAGITAVAAVICYPSMPDRIPMQYDFNGQVSTWADKSWATAAFPVLFVLFVGAVMAVSHWGIVHSKKASDPAAPVATAWAYGMFARAQSILMVALGVMVGLLGPFMELSFAGTFTLQQLVIPIMAVALIAVVASIAVGVVYGQNGARLIARVQRNAPLASDDDEHWKAGVFYVNRNDPSLFLPERFGIGWTMNWGRAGAWVIVGMLVLVTAAFCIGSILMVG